MNFSLKFHAQSDVGRIRKNNQDAGYASPTMLLVADGMGGAAAGDLASAVVATQAAKIDKPVETPDMLGFIGGLVNRGNDKLAELVEEDPTLDGMGTTFCGAMFDGTHLGVAHIGDSRLYRLRDGVLEQLTHDHSWVQTLIDEGRITPEQAATHPHRSLILKVLNGQPEPEPDYQLLDVAEGDRYLFCSDGLSGLISDEHIAELLEIEDLTACSEALTDAANEAGGHDNITVVLGDVVPYDDALAAAEPLMVGSAIEREIPAAGELAANPQGIGYPQPADSEKPEHDEAESARYAPDARTVRWPSTLVATVLIVAVIGAAVWGIALYSKSRYFIAEAEGNVAIYNGLPGSLLGLELNTLEERRDTLVTDLPRFYQRAVANTIGSPSLPAARDTADELHAIAEQCRAVREERQAPQPEVTPSPTTLPTDPAMEEGEGNPNYPTHVGPVTPTATEEVDPEFC